MSYALFAVAGLLALLKLGGISGAKPLFLRTLPAVPVATATEATIYEKAPESETLDLPDADGPTKRAGRLLAGLVDESSTRRATSLSSTDPQYARARAGLRQPQRPPGEQQGCLPSP